MSGICGCISFAGRAFPGTLSAMVEAAPYRGPDGIHSWTSTTAQLAHLALDVTAHDAKERQPRVEDNLVLVADARLDNRASLRHSLGDQVRADIPTDAALILAAYRRWGTDCPAHLLGDFAFALWDDADSTLFAACDPMGMRSLYYRGEERRLLFATEAKQILAAPGVPTRLNDGMIGAYLRANFDDLESSFYEGISALPPAHTLHVTENDCTLRRYWDLDPDRRITYDDPRDYVAHFRKLLGKAVEARLQSTNPVALLLSGGWDSGSIASMGGWLREQGDDALAPLHTYSWASDTFSECDERAVSDTIVDRYNLTATAIDAEACPLLGRRPYRGPDRDEPHVEGFHGLVDYAVRRARADGARQLLTGHRGDLVVGEWIFDCWGLFRTGQWKTLWNELTAYSARTGVPLGTTARMFLARPLRRALGPQNGPEWVRGALRRFYQMMPSAPSPQTEDPPWVRSSTVSSASPPDPPPSLTNPVRQQRYEAIQMPFHMRVARLTERHAARRGLTVADPWTDRRLVEFAFAVPPRALCRNGQNKWIVKEALQGIMPEPARSSAGKVNPYPIHAYALRDYLRPLIEDLFSRWSRDRGRGWVDPDRLWTHYERFRGGEETLDSRFWYALTLGLWLDEHHR